MCLVNIRCKNSKGPAHKEKLASVLQGINNSWFTTSLPCFLIICVIFFGYNDNPAINTNTVRWIKIKDPILCHSCALLLDFRLRMGERKKALLYLPALHFPCMHPSRKRQNREWVGPLSLLTHSTLAFRAKPP